MKRYDDAERLLRAIAAVRVDALRPEIRSGRHSSGMESPEAQKTAELLCSCAVTAGKEAGTAYRPAVISTQRSRYNMKF